MSRDALRAAHVRSRGSSLVAAPPDSAQRCLKRWHPHHLQWVALWPLGLLAEGRCPSPLPGGVGSVGPERAFHPIHGCEHRSEAVRSLPEHEVWQSRDLASGVGDDPTAKERYTKEPESSLGQQPDRTQEGKGSKGSKGRQPEQNSEKATEEQRFLDHANPPSGMVLGLVSRLKRVPAPEPQIARDQASQ